MVLWVVVRGLSVSRIRRFPVVGELLVIFFFFLVGGVLFLELV